MLQSTKQMEEHTLEVDGEHVIERDAEGHEVSSKDYSHVVRGFEAASHNKRVGREKAEEDAQIASDLKAVHDNGEDREIHVSRAAVPRFDSDKTKAHRHETHEETVHRHRQVGSLKANLMRDDRSEKTKERIREELRELGEEPEEFEQ
ncbi:hypothetical protein JCM8547_005250 [Rhodosporidiobolus lusitaniae]